MFKYGYDVNQNSNNSASHVIELIKSGSKVLEFGCATGYMSKILVEEKNCTVIGIEIDEWAAEQARRYCSEVIVGDIENLDLLNLFPSEDFDYIVFADVLEHLKRPELVLEKCKYLIKSDGQVLASIPNIAHMSIVLNLINGVFEYQKIGLLDNTHLKFFTKETALELFEKSGFLPKVVSRVTILPQNTEFSSVLHKYPENLINFINTTNKESNTYQFIIKAVLLNEENRFKNIYDTLESVKKEKIDLQREVNQLKESLVLQQQYSTDLEKIIEKKDKQFQELESHIDYMKNENDNNNRQFEQEMTKIKNLYSQLEESYKQQKAMFDNLNIELENKKIECNNKQRKIRDLEEEIESLLPEVEVVKKIRNSKILSKYLEWKS
ncbi:methyltransferase domain-containing protein [Paenibacillus sp. FSL M7-1455]|uniref:class I SAM-dependent methyltransferase n=1 Tax=Paenibacillus sp. FSL M7-1455 TaxID=2975316 RepID=UPI0030F7306C